ncbi:MAG: metallophosphoesterase family protein [Coriobacteriales bacterium]|nr:metallophosphoesterase family protein [Coriobacteriales bacterium]
MRRIALFSDIHANAAALDAVLADIEASGIEEVYCLGDLVGYGPRPGDVIARIRESGTPTITGNYDDGVGYRRGQCGCYYGTPEARADGDASYAFTDASLDDEEHAFLTTLLHEIRFEIDGARVLLCHGSPRRINEYLMPDRTDAHLAKLADAADADVVCVGHVHIPYHRALEGGDGRRVHYVSDGSVGKPKDGDPRGCWAELVFGGESEARAADPGDSAIGPVGTSDVWLAVRFHRAAYDIETVASEMVGAGLPPRLAEALRQA